jgi:hypothetical protein
MNDRYRQGVPADWGGYPTVCYWLSAADVRVHWGYVDMHQLVLSRGPHSVCGSVVSVSWLASGLMPSLSRRVKKYG